METQKVCCPHCGYKMPIEVGKDAVCSGLYVRCKGKNCRQVFEIKVNKKIK